MKRAVVALAGVLLIVSPAFGQRLVRTVVPYHYDLTLTPDFETDTFTGVERIEVSIQEPTKVVELHALEIEIDLASVVVDGVERAATVELDAGRQTARLAVATTIPPGPATLRLAYRGVLNDDLRGFYVGVQADGEKYAASQMEATDARRAFPSFDEPWMKATFAVSVVVDEGHTAFSNGAVVSDEPGPVAGKRTIRFATTPRMSTYLVALVVGRFECLEQGHNGYPIRVCATPEKVHLGHFALDATGAALDYFEDYFDYPYPFGKLDQIAVPDFAAGAMENTAAVIYRETALLLDPDAAATGQKRRVAGTVAHELAHMWFGDLVTMEWWDDIWLNEGFASFMTNKAVGAWKPEWNPALASAAASGYPMGTDTLSSTRKIRQQATTPEEIQALFDGIAYGKAAAVLRTVESYIGEESMRRGIADYMRRHAYGNTVAEDFYDALSDAAERDVAAVMRGYVNQPGLPLVSVEAVCEGDETVVTLAQERFFADRARLGSTPDQLWTVPVCFGEDECVLLEGRTRKASLSGCRDRTFANWRGRGYYLTAHRADLTGSIESLTAEERLVLLRDQWYLVRVGQLGIGKYLDLVAAVAPEERERRVVDQYLERVEVVGRDIARVEDRAVMEAWMRELLAPLAADLGWHPKVSEGPTEMELRASVYRALGMEAADPATRRRARELAEAYLRDPQAIHPTMATTVLRIAAREGDEALYERFRAALEAAADPEAAARWRAAVASFDDPVLRRRNLELVLSDEIRSQDKPAFFGAMVNDEESRAAVWDFLTSRWSEVLASLPQPFHQYLLPAFGRSICSEAERVEFEAFAASVDTAHEARLMAQTRERIANCLDLKTLHQASLSTYLGPKAGGLVRD